jgi:hypothetical protein
MTDDFPPFPTLEITLSTPAEGLTTDSGHSTGRPVLTALAAAAARV